ncbi:hypothetical protein [Dactylosporangium sp. CS-033363]|uniref:hypothetical protein n=1 Tax=Dactylosporangium sp. CS-033363 TaxID=3239935 RepID=UPI003D93F203
MRTYERRDGQGKLLERSANLTPGHPYDEQLYALVAAREDAGEIAGWWLAADDGDDGLGGAEQFVTLEDLLSGRAQLPALPGDEERVDAPDAGGDQVAAAAEEKPKARAHRAKSTSTPAATPAGQE